MTRCVEEKTDKKQLILEAVMELVKEKGSIINVTVAEIANQAGIGKGTVYQYFGNKEDLFVESINHHMINEIDIIEDIIDRKDIDFKKKIMVFLNKITFMVENNMNAQNMMQQLPAILCENPNLFGKMQKVKSNLEEKYGIITRKMYACGLEEGIINTKFDYDRFAIAIQTVTAGMMSILIRNPQYTKDDKEAYKTSVHEMIFTLLK